MSRIVVDKYFLSLTEEVRTRIQTSYSLIYRVTQGPGSHVSFSPRFPSENSLNIRSVVLLRQQKILSILTKGTETSLHSS